MNRVLATLLLLSLGLASAQDEAYDEYSEYITNPGGFAELNVFPYCKCTDYRCQASPYLITFESREEITPNQVQMCFRFSPVECFFNACCEKIYSTLAKVEFEVDNACKSQVLTNGTTLDGRQFNTYFVTLNPTGALKVTEMNQVNGEAAGKLLCITTLKGPCDTVDSLFQAHHQSFFNLELPLLSSFVDNSSPWRLEFVQADNIGSQTVFIYSLLIKEDSPCYPTAFRRGNCCNMTMNSISMSMTDEAKPSLMYSKVYTYTGQNLPLQALRERAGHPSCNYVVHGWQTEPGDATAVRDFSYPECCPTGVSNFCSQVITTRCNPYLSDSPYRLIFDSNITTDTASEVNSSWASMTAGS
eukprot:gene32284-16851_t